MIRPLRKRHLRMVVGLTVVVPALFVLGLTARQSIPSMEKLPVELGSDLPDGFVVLSTTQDLSRETPVRTTRFRDERAPNTRFALTIELLDDVESADLLAYWSESVGDDTRLPDDAKLLGAVGEGRRASWVLPDAADLEDGRVILYSLAKHEVVKVVKP